MRVKGALEEIETAVGAKAKHLVTQPGRTRDDAAFAELVAGEVRAWNADFQRGRRPYELADTERVAARVTRNLLGYGPLEPLLDDPNVWEIMVNAPDLIFVKRHRGPSGPHDEAFHDDGHVRRTLTRILDDASAAHRTLDPAAGLQDAQLDNGARLHIVHSDVARDGHLMFNIRKFTGVAYRSLAELTARGTLTPQVAAFLAAAAAGRLSILFAGAPGSGKTTLLSCCVAELDPQLRVVTAEEVFEVDIALPNVASMQTRPARSERPEIDLRRLVSGFLRMAPDVAVVGEVRDREAMPLLLTLSSGVTGFATVHAASAVGALGRLRLMCQLSEGAHDMPLSAMTQLVADSVDVVVHMARGPQGPVVREVIATEDAGRAPGVLGDVSDDRGLGFCATELFGNRDRPGLPCWTGEVPERACRRAAGAGVDLEGLMNSFVRQASAP